jgi:hypothetical protein
MHDDLMIFLPVIPIAAAIVGILRFLHFYNAYQRHLRENHLDEYKRLVLKDKLIEAAGAWIRWPVGSAYPIFAVFNIKQYYGDHHLFSLQKKVLIWFVICVVGFILSLLLFAKYGAT